MGISVNTNVAATRAGMYLASNHANLQKSLDRLSSGRRITEPADDAGGLAVSMKLEHTSKVLRGTSHNIANAISLLQVQDGVIKSAADIVTRIGELKSMASDVTKNTADKAAYNSEYADLKAQLTSLATTKFNGIGVFDQGLTTAQTTIYLDESGTQTMSWTNHNLNGGTDMTQLHTTATTLDPNHSTAAQILTQANVTDALEELATMRADNGGEVRRLQYAMANVETQITNITAANGRIMDVDVAAESSNLARQQVLVQASAAMTAQANMSNDVALMLLQ
jgi:flagellin